MEAKAVWRYARITPRKARAVGNLLRRKPLQEVYEILFTVPRKASRYWKKVVDSAVANYRERAGEGFDPDSVFIKEIFADQGPMWKRWLPRAMGRATRINKYTSHLTVTVADE